MKTSGFLTTAMAAVLLLSVWAAPDQGLAAPGSKAGAAPKPELWSVVKVGDELKVIKKTDLKQLQKTTTDEDATKKKQYEDAKKDAAKNKGKSDAPSPAGSPAVDLTQKPLKRTVKVLKSSCKTEQEATDWMEKYKADPQFEKKTAAG